MKGLICLLMLLAGMQGVAQKEFRIKSNVGDSIKLLINNKTYYISSEYTSIKTKEGIFDSLEIHQWEREESEVIMTNFENDSSYSLIGACCMSIDIVPTWRTEYDSLALWGENYDENFSKIKFRLKSPAKYTLKLKNGSKSDSIFAWNASYNCIPRIKQIDENGWNLGIPIKCYYWSNINLFQYFKTDSKFEDAFVYDGVYEDQFPKIKEDLGIITVRLFGNDNYTITYDLKTKEISITKDD